MTDRQNANLAARQDPRVQAIRTDRRVGSGSCSTLDECYEDVELLTKLIDDKVATPSEALAWAYRHELIYLERWHEVTQDTGEESVEALRRELSDRMEDLS